MNNEFVNVFDWFCANILSLNIKKTNNILFNHRNKKICSDTFILINDSPINRVPFCKFLGVIIDEHLTWINHINYVKSKISINIGFLSWICNFVSIKSALMLYYSLIYPYLIYCNIAWASNYPSRLKTLHISQKRSIRIIFHLPPGSSIQSKFVENNILNI